MDLIDKGFITDNAFLAVFLDLLNVTTCTPVKMCVCVWHIIRGFH